MLMRYDYTSGPSAVNATYPTYPGHRGYPPMEMYGLHEHGLVQGTLHTAAWHVSP